MDDYDIENLLRRCAPAGPPPDLRARIVRPAAVPPWPWVAAASLLLVVMSALHVETNRIERSVIAAPPQDSATVAVRDLAELLGGDDTAQRFARSEVARLQRAAASSLPAESETP
jgi:hypothetical protein